LNFHLRGVFCSRLKKMKIVFFFRLSFTSQTGASGERWRHLLISRPITGAKSAGTKNHIRTVGVSPLLEILLNVQKTITR
jgi:hypothetical protein